MGYCSIISPFSSVDVISSSLICRCLTRVSKCSVKTIVSPLQSSRSSSMHNTSQVYMGNVLVATGANKRTLAVYAYKIASLLFVFCYNLERYFHPQGKDYSPTVHECYIIYLYSIKIKNKARIAYKANGSEGQ